MNDPYEYTDEQLPLLKEYIAAEFQNTANELPFDEINQTTVTTQAKALYKRLKSYNRKLFKKIVQRARKQAEQEAVDVGYEKSEYDSESGLVAILLSMFYPVTGYVYTNEVDRKRDRMIESVISASDRRTLRDNYNRAAKLWYGQSANYADFVVDETRKDTFKRMGVQYVQWKATRDKRTCEDCAERDGTIYSIDAIPDKPHHNCRCVLIPISRR